MAECFKNYKLEFLKIGIGACEPLAFLRMGVRRGWAAAIYKLYLKWEDGHIRICREDRNSLRAIDGLSVMELERLDKILYWEYARLVRLYIYGDAISPLDYSRIFGKNLTVLREANGMSVSQLARALGTTQETQCRLEAGEEDIEADLMADKTDSALYRASGYFQVPASELLSQGLFYHIPVAGIKVCGEEMERAVKTFSKRQMLKLFQ